MGGIQQGVLFIGKVIKGWIEKEGVGGGGGRVGGETDYGKITGQMYHF